MKPESPSWKPPPGPAGSEKAEARGGAVEAAKEEIGPCRKLQCLVRHYADPTDLRAHRAALLAANAFIAVPFGPFIHPTIFRPAVGP